MWVPLQLFMDVSCRGFHIALESKWIIVGRINAGTARGFMRTCREPNHHHQHLHQCSSLSSSVHPVNHATSVFPLPPQPAVAATSKANLLSGAPNPSITKHQGHLAKSLSKGAGGWTHTRHEGVYPETTDESFMIYYADDDRAGSGWL